MNRAVAEYCNIRKGWNVLCSGFTFNHYQVKPYFYLVI